MTDTVIAIREVTFYAACTILSVTKMQTYVTAFITQMHAGRFCMINEIFKTRCIFWVNGRHMCLQAGPEITSLRSTHNTEARSERSVIGHITEDAPIKGT